MSVGIIILFSLTFSAFFSGVEIAFVSANKLVVELERKKGRLPGIILSYFINRPSAFIATVLLGNNIALVVYGLMMAKALEPWIYAILPHELHSEFIVLLIQTILSTILILIAAEFLPKTLFRLNPNNILNLLAIPALLCFLILYPVSFIFIWISENILKYLFRIPLPGGKYIFSAIDLDDYVREITASAKQEGDLEPEIQIFQNAIAFRNVKLRECMVPRPEIGSLEINSDISGLTKKFTETNHSKILIHSENIDNIIGYCHSYDIFSKPSSIQSILKPVLIVPETMLANKLMTTFIEEHKSVAVVVDEFGGTSGMVTMEDVIEEIFGEIHDEYDTDMLDEKQISANEYIFAARLEIDYLNNKYKLNLPVSEEYETLAGFILNHHESIPLINEKIKIETFTFTVLQATKIRIEKVHLRAEE